MTRHFHYAFALGVLAFVMPIRAASPPHADAASHNSMVWTNDDLEKLHNQGLISIVGQNEKEKPKAAPLPEPYERTEDPVWYAAQAAELNEELERNKTKLSEYEQAIDDARSLRDTTAGISLGEGEFAISPEVGVEILERQVDRVQAEIRALEDLARRHDIPPGVLRGE